MGSIEHWLTTYAEIREEGKMTWEILAKGGNWLEWFKKMRNRKMELK